MQVREFRPEDARQCSRIIEENHILFTSKENPLMTIRALLKESKPNRLIHKSKTRLYFVAQECDQIFGIGGIKDDQVQALFVRPDMQRRGIGRMLMDAIEEDAKKHGVRTLICQSSMHAQGFFEKMGFGSIRTKTVGFKGTPLTHVQMAKSIMALR